MWQYNYRNDILIHYGVKGMKWGVRKTKVSNRGNLTKKRGVIFDALKTGKIKLEVNEDKQGRHIRGHKNFQKSRSYLYGDMNTARELVKKLSLTGEPIVTEDKKWLNKERVKNNRIIGVCVDKQGNRCKTRNAIIHYSKSGTHIVPRKGE